MTPAQRTPARTRLLEAADRVLFERGIRDTPVDELLRQAKVSAATLYTHFGSKDALVAEALRVRLADWRTVWDQHIVAADNVLDRLLAVFNALASYRGDQRHPSRWCAFLADEVLLAYSGTLAGFLRGAPPVTDRYRSPSGPRSSSSPQPRLTRSSEACSPEQPLVTSYIARSLLESGEFRPRLCEVSGHSGQSASGHCGGI